MERRMFSVNILLRMVTFPTHLRYPYYFEVVITDTAKMFIYIISLTRDD